LAKICDSLVQGKRRDVEGVENIECFGQQVDRHPRVEPERALKPHIHAVGRIVLEVVARRDGAVWTEPGDDLNPPDVHTGAGRRITIVTIDPETAGLDVERRIPDCVENGPVTLVAGEIEIPLS